MRLGVFAWVCVLCAALPASARAGDDASFLDTLWDAAIAELEGAARARVPALVPPEPIEVRWRARRVGSVELKAPLLALGAGDLDGDGKAELFALTTAEVVVIGVERGALVVRARASLPRSPASVRPRDPVGTLALTAGGEILARSSERARAAAMRLTDGALVVQRELDGFPLCEGVTAELVAGRNYFDHTSLSWSRPGPVPTLGGPFYAAHCAAPYVDATGRPMTAFASVATDGALSVAVARACPAGDRDCAGLAPDVSTVAGAGVGFAVADVDRDGRADVIASSDRPRGDPDRVAVWSPRGSRWKSIFDHGFSGGVPALAAGDLDGDGDLEVMAAVRLIGAHRVDVWALN